MRKLLSICLAALLVLSLAGCDVETVFLYPWAVTVQDAGIDGLLNLYLLLLQTHTLPDLPV